MKIYSHTPLPLYVWADQLEEGAWIQGENLAHLPFAHHHIALMADVHQGFGMPIGGVLACRDWIIPNGVGVDIGCGVQALRLPVETLSQKALLRIIRLTHQGIPLGFAQHKGFQDWEGFQRIPDLPVFHENLGKARCQLGTLGSGNHFLSVEQGSDGHLWLLLHSGSRHLGHQVAQSFNQQAKSLNQKERWVDPAFDLAPLPLNSPLGQQYLMAMTYCLEYARANRDHLAQRFLHYVQEVLGPQPPLEVIDIHHNYASLETHFETRLIVHRKGATRAFLGEKGIIPGSMGTSSYLVEGLGNPASFMSCSHGCGRRMSRSQANQVINRQAADTAKKGIVFMGWNRDYSEAPMAYKDIDTVMAQQKDLVRPLVRLSPLGVVKG